MKKTMKKITALLLALLLAAGTSVTAFAEDQSYENQNGNFSETVDLNYTVAHKGSYTDVSCVRLSWSVPVVKYSDDAVTTWDIETLTWKEKSGSSTTDNEVSFTLTNRGSCKVCASVSFKPEITDSARVTYGKIDTDGTAINRNDPVIESIVDTEHKLKEEEEKEAYITKNCAATISGTVTLDAAKLTAVSGKLGTYTVTISEPVSQ